MILTKTQLIDDIVETEFNGMRSSDFARYFKENRTMELFNSTDYCLREEAQYLGIEPDDYEI